LLLHIDYKSGKVINIKIRGGNIMALIQCPECGKEISNSAKMCPHCGYKLKNNIKQKIWGKRLTIIGLISIISTFVYSAITSEKRLQLRAYALTHNNYYPTSYYIASFITDVLFYGGILLVIIGLILLILYKINSNNITK
jgi:ribosomal protein L37E